MEKRNVNSVARNFYRAKGSENVKETPFQDILYSFYDWETLLSLQGDNGTNYKSSARTTRYFRDIGYKVHWRIFMWSIILQTQAFKRIKWTSFNICKNKVVFINLFYQYLS